MWFLHIYRFQRRGSGIDAHILHKMFLRLCSSCQASQHIFSLCLKGQINPEPSTTVQPAGGLAQMVERSLSMREVAGSMPASSTLLSCVCVHQIDAFCHVHVQAYWSLSRVVYIQVNLYNMTLCRFINELQIIITYLSLYSFDYWWLCILSWHQSIMGKTADLTVVSLTASTRRLATIKMQNCHSLFIRTHHNISSASSLFKMTDQSRTKYMKSSVRGISSNGHFTGL